jgi:hypothetical protein
MVEIGFDAFRDDLNRDPEFAHTARYWDSRIRLGIGDDPVLLSVRDGALADVRPYQIEDSCDLSISAPVSDWEKFLAEVPPPMYHSLYAVTFHHDFEITGDLTDGWAYMQALIRLFDVMRRHTVIS